MARSVDQIQSDLDALNAAKARPEKLVVFPDGRRVQYRDMDELLKAIAATEEELRKASGGTGSRVRFAQHIERAAQNFGQMSLDVKTALPTAITTWQSIGTNVAGITANVNQLTKPRWYDRLLGYGLNGVVIYRNLNPATSLTVKGAQLISSRP